METGFPQDLGTSQGSKQPAWTEPGSLAMYIITSYLFVPSDLSAAHDTRGLPLRLTTVKTDFFPALSTTLLLLLFGLGFFLGKRPSLACSRSRTSVRGLL